MDVSVDGRRMAPAPPCGHPRGVELSPKTRATMPENSTMSLADATRALTAPGQTFEMEELDIRGVPTRVWKNAPGDLRAVIELSRGHGDSDYLVYEDERTTFVEHYRLAATIASALKSRFDVAKGDRVAIVMRNLPEWAMAFWGSAGAGAVIVPLNAWWAGPELHYGLKGSGATGALVDAGRLDRLLPHLGDLPELKAVVVTHEDRTQLRVPGADFSSSRSGGGVPVVMFSDLVGEPDADAAFPDVDLKPEDDCTIFYTSGTTGKPKGAVGTHRNMCTNLMSLYFINSRTAMVRARPEGAFAADGGPSSYLLSVPLFHATGCHSVLVANTVAGNKLVMMHHWDPERALELIERERIVTFGGVPAMVMQVIDSPSFATRDTSSVRGVAYGGAPAPPDLVRRIKEHFPVSAPSNGYGLTETSAGKTMNSGDDYVHKPGSVGPPVPVCDVAIVP